MGINPNVMAAAIYELEGTYVCYKGYCEKGAAARMRQNRYVFKNKTEVSYEELLNMNNKAMPRNVATEIGFYVHDSDFDKLNSIADRYGGRQQITRDGHTLPTLPAEGGRRIASRRSRRLRKRNYKSKRRNRR